MRPIAETVLLLEDAARRRPVLLDLWHPEPLGARHPTIVLSHGAFGAARNYAWLAKSLARHGYIVVGVNHHGESFAYGPETIDPAAPFRPEQRTRDCSFALDHLLADSAVGEAIDRGRVGALGHSSGGATVIALGGGIFDAEAMRRYCVTDGARGDCGCAYGRDLSALPPPAPSTTQRDQRVAVVVALDPALGPGHDARSLTAVTVPVHIVGAVQNDFLPFAQHAGRYARLIPGASLTRLTRGEGHFVFLDEDDRDLAVHGVPLFRDRPGVDRARVHAQLADVVLNFFDRHLGVHRDAEMSAVS